MQKSAKLVVLASIVCALASCGALFEYNVFKGFQSPPARAASDYQGEAGLDLLAADLSSPTVVETLAADPVLVAEIKSDISAAYLADGVSGQADQRAAILYADLSLKTTSAEELVNNIVVVLVNGLATSGSAQSLLQGVVPADVAGDPDAFAAMVRGLMDASYSYSELGESIDTPPADGVADGSLPEGTLVGDVAQKAAVAYVVRTIADAAAAAMGSTDAAIDQLYKMVYDPANVDSAVQGMSFPSDVTSFDLGTAALLDLAGITIPTI